MNANLEHLKIRAKARKALLGRRGLRRKPAKWLHPDAAQRQYARELRALVDQARQAALGTLGEIAKLLKPAQDYRMDAPADGSGAVKLIGSKVRSVFTPEAAAKPAESMAMTTSAWNRTQFRRVVKSVIGVDIVTHEPWLADVLATTVVSNVSLIRNVGEQAAADVESLVTTALRQGIGQGDLADQIMERFAVSERRANLIARDQVSKLNADLTQTRQKDIGVKRYVWRTAGDERVRESHAAQEGKTFDWSKPPAGTGHPGHDINCRCYAEADLDHLLDQLEQS